MAGEETALEPRLPQVSTREILFLLFKWKWSILVILSVTMVSVVTYLWIIRDDLYVTEAKLLVKLGVEQAPPTTVVGQQPMVIGYRSADVNSEIDILTSTELLAQLVDGLAMDRPAPPPPVPAGLFPKVKYYAKRVVRWARDWKEEILIRAGLRERLTPREKAIATLAQGLSVEARKDSNVVVAKLSLPFRKDSSVVLNTLLDDYREFRLKVYQDQGGELFRDLLAESAEELRLAEAALHDYEARWGIHNQVKQRDLLLEQLARVQHELHEAEIDSERAQARVERLETELAKQEPNYGALGDVVPSSFQQHLLDKMADLDRRRQELRLTELDDSERLRNNRAQFQALAGTLGANLRSVLSEKKAGSDARRQDLAALEADLDELHDKEMSWTELRRQMESAQDNYLFYRRKLEESSATGSALAQQRTGNVTIIQRAMDPIRPAGPRKTLLLGLAAVAALSTAFAFVSLAQFLDHRIYALEELEAYLSVPVIATIPSIGKRALGRFTAGSRGWRR